MSEQHHESGNVQEPHLVAEWIDGGHEVDAPMARGLFVLTTVLIIVTIASSIGVSQLFQQTSADMIETNAKIVDADLTSHRDQMDALVESYGQNDKDTSEYRIPITRAMDLLLKTPARLRAAAAPPDFVHPDDAKKQPTN